MLAIQPDVTLDHSKACPLADPRLRVDVARDAPRGDDDGDMFGAARLAVIVIGGSRQSAETECILTGCMKNLTLSKNYLSWEEA